MEKQSYDFAEKYFLGFLATSTLTELRNRSGLMFVGLPRVGKSSAVAVQRGTALYVIHSGDGTTAFEPNYQHGDPLVSHSTVAKTIGVNIFRDFQNQRNIIDTPGQIDNRAGAYRLWTSFSLETAFALTESIDATCVVIHYTNSFSTGANADSFRDLAEVLMASAGVGEAREAFLNNLCFLFTHVGPQGTKRGVLRRLHRVYIDHLKEQVKLLTSLAGRFPRKQKSVGDFVQGAALKLAQTCLAGMDEVDDLRREIARRRGKIDFEDHMLREDPDMKSLERISACMLLLETIIENPRRLVLSRPNGHVACKIQREAVERAVRECRTLDRQDIKRIVACRRLPNYEVYGVLEHVARSMTERLDTYNRALSTFLESVTEQDQIICSITDDWQAYRDSCVAKLRTDKKTKQRRCERLEEEISRLERSTDLLAPPGNIHTACKFQDSWLSWMGLFSISTTVTHDGPYEEIVVTGKHGSKEVEKEGSRTIVRVCSERGHHIDAQVRFLRHERDLEQTKQTVAQERTRLCALKEDMDGIDGLLSALESVTSDESLLRILVYKKMEREVAALIAAGSALTEEVVTPIVDDDTSEEVKVSFSAACSGLQSLLDTLITESTVPTDVSHEMVVTQGAGEDTDGVVHSHYVQSRTMKTYLAFLKSFNTKEALVKRFKQNSSAVNLAKASSTTVADPTKAKNPKPFDKFDGQGVARDFLLLAIEFVKEHILSPLELTAKAHPTVCLTSVGFALLGCGMKLHPFTIMAILLITFGMLRSVAHGLYEIRRIVQKEIDSIRHEIEYRMDEATDLLRDSGTEAARQVDGLKDDLLRMLEDRARNAEARWSLHGLLGLAITAIKAYFHVPV